MMIDFCTESRVPGLVKACGSLLELLISVADHAEPHVTDAFEPTEPGLTEGPFGRVAFLVQGQVRPG
jgi:hypothetical protein